METKQHCRWKRSSIVDGNEAALWNAETGERICTLRQHDTNYGSMRFAIGADGKYVLTGDDAGTYLWDAAAGCRLSFSLQEKVARVAVFSPDGKQIAAASDAKT